MVGCRRVSADRLTPWVTPITGLWPLVAETTVSGVGLTSSVATVSIETVGWGVEALRNLEEFGGVLIASIADEDLPVVIEIPSDFIS